MHVSFALAFAAGLLSFLSPCFFPLVPAYLSFLTGAGAGRQVGGGRTVALALAFAAGFGLVFVALGATASALGRVLSEHRRLLEIGGGLAVVALGLHMLGVLRIALLQRDLRFHAVPAPRGLAGAVLVGAAFGLGWSPCVGPILGGVLTLAASRSTLDAGVLLLASYALGLAVPFVAAAAMVRRLVATWRVLGRALPWAERISGAMLAAFGILLLTGDAGWLGRVLPGFEALSW